MKKTILVLAIMLVSIVSIQAQNLTNSAWTTMLPGDEEIEMVLNFDDDGECYIILTTEDFEPLDADMSLTLRASLAVPGIYNQDGRDITISFNKKKAEFSLDYDINGADIQAKTLFESMIKPEVQQMEPDFKHHLLEMVPAFMDDMKVISVSKSKLILGDSTGEKLTFYPTGKG
ncbi:MAG: hypothetical protein IKX31_02965 [Muribaculaceae bacterium]|nr:hypothetical protein [Muribaculaceae bacterium]